MGVADMWDALTCDRPYRRAMTLAEAVKVMGRASGHHLDPECVNGLFAVLGIGSRDIQADLSLAA